MVLYLCIDNERSSRAGSLGDAWSVDSTTPYNIYKGPHDLVGRYVRHVKYYSYLCCMTTITFLIVLLIGIYILWVFRKTIQVILIIIGILTVVYYLNKFNIISLLN